MTMFWVYALLLTAVALAILITPLMRNRARMGSGVSRAASNLTVIKDQFAELDADLAAGNIEREQWEAARADLQRGVLEDAGEAVTAVPAPVARAKLAAVAIVVAVPLVSVLLYLGVGSPQSLDPSKVSAAPSAPHQLTQEQIESMAARLAQRLEANPDDIEGWIMLARTYGALGRFDQAAGAYAKAEVKFPQDAQLLADYADSLAMAQGQSLRGKPEALIQRALKADGNNIKVLALAGTLEFEKQNFGKAVEYWQRILSLLPPDAEMGNSVRASIQDAEAKLGAGPKAPASVVRVAPDSKAKPATAPATAAAKGARLSGTVKLAPALAARAAPEDTVFVLARPATGSRTPLAAVRAKVKDLPLAFSFDDSMAMNPAIKLSGFAEVVVAARVSKSGNAMPESGDLEGVSKPVHPGTSGLTIEIVKQIQ